MEIGGRRAICYYVSDAGFHYVELIEKESDCPEKKSLRDCLTCEGDCQGTYLAAAVRGDDITIIGTIFPTPHAMYNPDFLSKHGFKTIGEAQEYINKCIERGEGRIEPSMGGRRKRVYLGDEHAETLFKGCTFRHARGQYYRQYLEELRRKDLDEIALHLPSLKKEAEAVDLKDLEEKLGA